MEDFDDVLEHVGGWGRYQIMLVVVSLPFNVFMAYAMFTPVLVLYTPDHRCSLDPALLRQSAEIRGWSVEDLVNWTIPKEEDGSLSKCFMYNLTESQLPPYSDNGVKVPCQFGWDYNTTGLFASAVTDMDWVCNDAWRGPFTQSMAFLGAVVGALVFGSMADYFGRYPTFVLTNAILFISGVVTPFCTDFYSFVLARFIMGTTFYTFYTLIYVLALEYVSVEKRSLISNLGLAVGLTVGGAVEPWILKALGDWKIFHIILFAQAAVVVITPFFVYESVRWLMERGEAEKSVVILRKIAKANGREVSEGVYDDFRALVNKQFEESKGSAVPGFLAALRKPRLRRNIILAILAWTLTLTIFDGHVRNIVNLNYDIYTTFSVSAALELPADLLCIYVLDVLGRRWSAFASFLLSSAFMFACSFTLNTTTALVLLSMLGRFFICIASNAVFQFSVEMMPTVIRGQASAIANAMGTLFTIASPYIAHSSNVYPALPFYILSAAGILAAAVTVALPETANEKLANTLDEGEEFGCGQSFFLVPFLEQRRREKMQDQDSKSRDHRKLRLSRTTSGKYLGSHRFQTSRSVATLVQSIAHEQSNPDIKSE